MALRREHYEKINGVSNQFWGWGGEDDDMYKRVIKNGLKITRYITVIARYTTIEHKKAKATLKDSKYLSRSMGGVYFERLHYSQEFISNLGLMPMDYPLWHINSSQVIHMISIQILLYNFKEYLSANDCLF